MPYNHWLRKKEKRVIELSRGSYYDSTCKAALDI